MKISAREIQEWTGGIVSPDLDLGTLISTWALDSREVTQGCAFVAIQGERTDGHSFIDAAIEKGAVLALVEKPGHPKSIQVSSVVEALKACALAIRSQFRGPVIGVTGSVGKSITKEFTAAALGSAGRVLKSPGNRNTEYSSPLIWLESEGNEKVAVIEMAMRGFGQIRHLAAVSRPTIGVITQIGHSHLELVGSREGIANAKGELLEALPSGGTAILNHDDPFTPLLMKKFGGEKLTYGFDSEADMVVASYQQLGFDGSLVRFRFRDSEAEVSLPIPGKGIAANAAAAVLAATSAGIRFESAVEGLANAQIPLMRLQRQDFEGKHILLDAYNAGPESMAEALAILNSGAKSDRFVILGEMRELGYESDRQHERLGELISSYPDLQGRFLGPSAGLVSGASQGAISPVASLEDLKTYLASLPKGATVLIKGSRALELERVLEPNGAGI